MKKRYFVYFGLLASMSYPAFAQSSPSTANDVAPQAASNAAIEDIVVMAQRREERLQDVPVAVSVISSTALQSRGVSSTADLTTAVPGLNLTRSSNVWQPFLRGVGTATFQPGSDPSIPVYIDGVYLSAPGNLMFSFNNIQRIEVLKGPQGTLFGRNATGGLIQIVTQQPTGETTARANLGYGSYGRFESSAYLSGGTDTVAGSLALIYNDQNNGWGTNLYTPSVGPSSAKRDVGVAEELGIHAKLAIRPSDEVQFNFGGMFIDTKGDQYQYRNPLPGQGVLASGTVPYFFTGGFYDTNQDVPFSSHSRQYLFISDASYDAAFATIKSITSYLTATASSVTPADASPQITRVNQFTQYKYRTFTQEMQILSNGNSGPSWLQWIGGVYYLHSKGIFNNGAGGSPIDLDTRRTSSQVSESIAAYGQASFDITSRTKVTLGLRFNHDKITADQITVGANPLAATNSAAFLGRVSFAVLPVSKTFQELTWRGVIDHHLNDDVLLYGSVSRGYKAGAWNHGQLCPTTPVIPACATVAPPAKPEILDAYEIGVKSLLLGRRLKLNLSGYYYNYKDLQVGIILGNPPFSIITNAASARIYGFDVEVEARATSNLVFTANASYLDSKYRDYPGAVRFTRRNVAPYGAVQSTFNAAGNSLIRAPRFSATIGFDWTIPTSIGLFGVAGNIYHTSKIYWDAENRLSTASYNLVNGQLSWSATDQLRLRLWGKNLAGRKYYSLQSSSAFGDAGVAGAPRTYGVGIDWKL